MYCPMPSEFIQRKKSGLRLESNQRPRWAKCQSTIAQDDLQWSAGIHELHVRCTRNCMVSSTEVSEHFTESAGKRRRETEKSRAHKQYIIVRHAVVPIVHDYQLLLHQVSVKPAPHKYLPKMSSNQASCTSLNRAESPTSKENAKRFTAYSADRQSYATDSAKESSQKSFAQ